MSQRLVFFEMPLHPTHINLDVVVCGDKNVTAFFLHRRYGESEGYYQSVLTGPMVCNIYHEGEQRVLMVLRSFDPGIAAHEALHVTWKIADAIGMKWDSQSQELQAYFITHIVNKIMEHKKTGHGVKKLHDENQSV